MRPIQHGSSGLQEQVFERGHHDLAVEVTQRPFCHIPLVGSGNKPANFKGNEGVF